MCLRAFLKLVDTLLVVGPHHDQTLQTFCRATKRRVQQTSTEPLQRGEVVYWSLRSDQSPKRVKIQPPKDEHQRHRRKYAHGDIHEKSFFFRGPEGKLNLRAQNLAIFLQIAEGVDDATWSFHLKQHDYSSWIKTAIKDDELADRVAEVEKQAFSANESRDRIRRIVSEKYTEAA